MAAAIPAVAAQAVLPSELLQSPSYLASKTDNGLQFLTTFQPPGLNGPAVMLVADPSLTGEPVVNSDPVSIQAGFISTAKSMTSGKSISATTRVEVGTLSDGVTPVFIAYSAGNVDYRFFRGSLFVEIEVPANIDHSRADIVVNQLGLGIRDPKKPA